MIYCDCRTSIDDLYFIYCQNMIRAYFVDKYLRSVEYQRLATQHRIDYICWRLKR